MSFRKSHVEVRYCILHLEFTANPQRILDGSSCAGNVHTAAATCPKTFKHRKFVGISVGIPYLYYMYVIDIQRHTVVYPYIATCGRDCFVPFSCKGRGFCSSCCGRRMADTAAHLVDRVLPEIPCRQWVLTLPYTLRFLMAYDSKLITEIHNIFIRSVSIET